MFCRLSLLRTALFLALGGLPSLRAQLPPGVSPNTVQFAATAYAAQESDGSVTISVTRSGRIASAATVNYATSDTSGGANVRYVPMSGTLTFAANDPSPQTFTVPLINNAAVDGDQVVQISLSDPTGDAILGTPAAARLTILDDESPMPNSSAAFRVSQTAFSTVQFAATAYAAQESDGSVTISVTRSGRIASAATVNYATSDTSGGANVRYVPMSGTLTFAANDPSPQTFTVPLINNAAVDGDQVVQISLKNPKGDSVALGSFSTTNITIVDDDAVSPTTVPAGIRVSDYSVREDAGPVGIVVARTDDGTSRVAVNYATADDTGAKGRYTPTRGTLIFEPGDFSPRVISIPLVNNKKVDGSAVVALRLTNTAGVPASSALLTIVDDDAAPATLPTTFQFVTPVFSAFETDGTTSITVTRTGGPTPPSSVSNGTVSVQYFVSDDTGQLGADYENTFTSPTSGTLFWTANDFTPKTFTVTILRDRLNFGNVRAKVTLTSPKSFTNQLGNVIIPASLGTPNQATLSIVDADLPSVLQFSQGSYQTFEDRGAAVLNVVRTGGLGNAVAVAYTTGGGTAVPGLRYTPASGILSWPAGDSTPRSIVIPILQNGDLDPDQTIGVTLGQVQGNAVLGPQSTATLLLTDDDGGQFLPVLSVDSSLAPQATTDGRTKGVFIITRRDRLGNVPNLGLPLVVAYSARGAALPGVEYRALSGMATIPAGRDTVKIKVKAINGGGGRVSNVKLTLNPGTGYFVTPGAAKAKVKIVFPGTMP